MNEIKRFDLDQYSYECDTEAYMDECDDGDYVLYSDVAPILKELEELRYERERQEAMKNSNRC